jgi:TP901 family phage tail tape measure protein
VDDFVIDIVLNAANVRPGLEALVRELRGLSQEGVNADKAVSGLERIIAKLSTATSAAGKATSAATDKNAAYSASIKAVTSQLGALEAAQAKAARQQLSQVELPASINRNPTTGQFTSPDVSNLNIQQSRAVAAAYDLQTQSLRSLNAAHLKELEATGASTAAEAAQVRQLEAASKQQAIYNQYLYDEAKAAEAAKAAQLNGLGATRNALTNTGRALTTFGLGLIAVSALPAIVSTQFQSSFAQVERTVQGAGAGIKASLVDLSQQIPVTFQNLSEIAALGGQLGIAKSGIVDFTETVAKLTATTDLSAEVAGTFLGRVQSLLNVPASQFENIASAILKVGVNSVATESQIVTIATRIAGAGKTIGLSAVEVIGFAGALASVGVKPYAASGTVTRLASVIRSAVTQGGDDLKTLADIAGVSSEKFRKSFESGNFDGTFTKLITGFGDVSKTGGDAAAVLAKLGLTGSTDAQTFRQLAAGAGSVAQAFRDAASGAKNNNTLTEQYGKIAETTSAKIKILGNDFLALFNAIGQAQQGPLNYIVTQLSDFVKTLTEIASNPAGQTFLTIATVLGLVAGALALVGGLAAKTIAGILGITQAIGGMSAAGLTGNGVLLGMAAELETVGGAGAVAAGGLRLVQAALLPLAVIGAVLTLAELGAQLAHVTNASEQNVISFKNAGGALKAYQKQVDLTKSRLNELIKQGNGSQRTDILANVTGGNGVAGNIAKNIPVIGDLGGELSGFTTANDAIQKIDKSMANLVKNNSAGVAANEFQKWQVASQSLGLTQKELAALFPAYSAQIKKSSDAIKEAAASTDRFNAGAASQKDIVTVLNDLTGLNAKAQGKFADSYAKSVSTLTSFNSVVQQVQASQTAALGANASQAQQNKAQEVSLDALTKQYQTNNDAQKQWAANLVTVAAQYGPEAANQFIQAGYSAVNNSILQQLVNATPEQAQAYIAAQQEAASLAGQATAQAILASGYITTQAGGKVGADTAKALADLLGTGIGIDAALTALQLKINGHPLEPVVNPNPAISAINTLIQSQNGRTIRLNVIATGTNGAPVNIGAAGVHGTAAFASGGHVRGPGTGTSDSIPARLSNGEYVIRAAAVRKYGQGMFDQLNRGVAKFASGGPVRKFANGGPVSPSVVTLAPRDRMALGNGRGDVVIMIDGREVARAVNNANGQSGALGAN